MIISVIVPVYKVEKYIHRCIDSILAQTFTDFELILVDDGSPDRCGEICDEYAKKDDRIVVIHKDNGGVSDARNAGLDWMFEHSSSEWVTFIDSDDWVRPTYLEKLYHAAQRNPVSICGYQKTKDPYETVDYETYHLQSNRTEDFFCDHNKTFVVAWGKLYKAEDFINIRYPLGKIHEDEYVTYQILFQYETFAFVDEPLYVHIKNPESIGRSKWTPEKMVKLDAVEEQINYFEKNGFRQARSKAIQIYAITICDFLSQISNDKDHDAYAGTLRKLLREHLKKYHNETGIKDNTYYLSFAYPKKKQRTRISRRIRRRVKRAMLPQNGRIGIIGKAFLKRRARGNMRQFDRLPEPDDYPVDFVVSWVDDKDPEWRSEKQNYEGESGSVTENDNPDARYRDWDIFHYWFRAVEKNAPWVRKIFLLTWGHVPEWLEEAHPKLKIVRHYDFIPAQYLPTFSSHVIELYMWRIEELAEHFIYFNDDMLLTAPVMISDFFCKGLPKYCPLTRPKYTFDNMTVYEYVLMNNTGLFNSAYDFREVILKHPEKWICPFKSVISEYNLRTYSDGYLSGMRFSHVCVPYLKSSMKKCAERFSEKIDETSRRKFRTYRDINHQIFQIWAMVNAEFIPVGDYYYGRLVNVSRESMSFLQDCIQSGQNKSVCINDNDALSDDDYDLLKPKVIALLEEAYPERSGFEK